jgi:hypothetical protein
MKQEPPRPTLDQLQRQAPWWLVVCTHCLHPRPVALTLFIIRWGPGTSSDMLCYQRVSSALQQNRLLSGVMQTDLARRFHSCI